MRQAISDFGSETHSGLTERSFHDELSFNVRMGVWVQILMPLTLLLFSGGTCEESCTCGLTVTRATSKNHGPGNAPTLIQLKSELYRITANAPRIYDQSPMSRYCTSGGFIEVGGFCSCGIYVDNERPDHIGSISSWSWAIASHLMGTSEAE